MARAKTLSKADQQLWAAFTQNILLLPGKTKFPLDPPEAPAPEQVSTPAASAAKPKQKLAQPYIHPTTPPTGIDKSTWRNLATGKRRPERKLDLHGLTATRAHHATIAFIQQAHTEQTRCIEIVTGKGEILARELPHWLNAPTIRPLILAIAYAPTANMGAIRILLRRTR
jgi:DNA-nicking Smr family endonuclease